MERRRTSTGRAALLVAATLGVAACGGSSGSSSSSSTAGTTQRAPSVSVSVAQLKALAAAVGHPIYWAGQAKGTYELTRIADGRTYIRYLPAGAQVGTHQTYLTVGTYVRSSPPYAAVRQSAMAKHATTMSLHGGVLAVQYPARPQSVYLVFPSARYEVEVYDPSPAAALRLATSRKIAPVR
jgi:hypothetical protein